jgi:Uma2 family endonuclease
MATAPANPRPSLTAEQFAGRPDPGCPEELVRGRIVPIPPPGPRHGAVCNKVGRLLGNFIEDHDLGHILSNDSGIITQRGPDTVRGADIAFSSYGRLPKGPLPSTYPEVAPELVIEVRSPRDRWPKILIKVAEYLDAGSLLVVVLDPEPRTAYVQHADGPPQVLGPEDELAFPDWLGGFRMPLRRVFG